MVGILERVVLIIILKTYLIPAAVISLILVAILIRQGEAKTDFPKIDQ